ncbi:SulP family inorganic anion transporter [Actinotalea sp. M2MS4P-6]|uniref:SulP family inorganic anion transporter n=1 Tax=Actinotalea sp. M2MS4P-6 TaxID=2983762 RepID=UPI0021E46965|nr:SulP family inorganic anion transporter [Actinotalea sp. M2MS4P-6]MCV2396420.1 SulP family inorganic anion transporter [Actinotalea sp. M2MS4P-6]
MTRPQAWPPAVATVRGYRREWWRRDLVAGLVLTAMLVPAGIGYARAAGLPPETGLYATVVPLLVYAVLGPSRILVLGPDSSLAPIIAAAVLPLAAGSDRRIALAGVLAVLVGGWLVLGGLLRAGAVTALLSRPIRVGYLNGIAVVVLAGQLPALLGLDGAGISLELPWSVHGGTFVPLALGFGLGSLAALVVARLTGHTVLGLAGVVVASAALVALLGLGDRLPVVGALPSGLPHPALAGATWADVRALVAPAAGIALIAFTDTGVLSRSLAARHGETVDGSAEMRGLGAANLATGLLAGFPISGSSSRTPVAETAGARTQLTCVVGALGVTAFVLVAPGATAWLPSATLAAVVVVAASSLVDVPGLARLVRTNPLDGALSMIAFAGVVTLGVLQGIVVAVVLSLAAFVYQASRPYRAELGLVHGVRGYHDLARHPEGERVPGCVIVRFDAPLFFGNGERFDAFVRSTVARRDDARLVVLAAEPITDVDSTAVEQLVALDDWLTSRGITFVLAEAKGPVKDRLRRYEPARFGPERFAPTVGAAVDSFTGRLRGDLDE